jgi:N-acetylated-alpha-linked acidic dipeptidase
MRDVTRSANDLINSGQWALVQDPTERLITPKAKDAVPHLNFAPLQNALNKLQASASTYQRAARTNPLPPAQQKQLDEILFKTERTLTRQHGLPRRDWFRHHIYAPGFYTGYGVKTLPGIREAIEQRDWKEAEEQIAITASVIEKFAEAIDNAAGLIL